MTFSDCNIALMSTLFKTEQGVALCDSELRSFGEFVTALVDDGGPGVFSREDLMAVAEAYAGNSNPKGAGNVLTVYTRI